MRALRSPPNVGVEEDLASADYHEFRIGEGEGGLGVEARLENLLHCVRDIH